MAFGTYSELVASINDWLDRADLSGAAPDMIALAEARMRRELIPFFSEKSVTSTSDADGVLVVPADFGKLNRVSYNGFALPQIGAVPAADGMTGTVPTGYSMEGGAIRLWPAGAYEVTILYHPVLAFLSESNPTNDLLEMHPDLYFYGAMLYAHGYVKDDQRASDFKALWEEALFSAGQYFTRQTYTGNITPRVGFVP